MRIHVAALAALSLLVLAGPRAESSQARLQGIPLGDLVRVRPTTNAPKPEVPTEPNPTLTQLTPGLGGTSSTGSVSPPTGSVGSETTLGTPGSTTGTPSSSLGGAAPNLTTPGLPSATPNGSTVGGAPTTTTPNTTGVPSTTGGMPPTTGANPNPTPVNP
jgi:hypothetical protein